MKRTLLFAMAVCICILTAPNYAATSGDYTYTDNGDTTCTITDYLGPGGKVTIPDTLSGLTVVGIDGRAFEGTSSLTGVIIPDSVTFIGIAVFGYCNSLTTIKIPDSVITIDSWAFEGCSGLTNVTIGSGVSTIGTETFWACTGLTGFYFKGDAPTLGSDLTLGGVTATVYYSQGTTGWEATYGGLPTALWDDQYTWTDNGDMTCTITGYTGPGGNVTIPDTLGGLTVTVIGNYAFFGSSNLTGVTIPDGVTTIGSGAFELCNNLTGSLTIPDSVVTIGNSAFKACGNLTGVTIGNNVTTIGNWAFSDNFGLTGFLTIPDSVVVIGDGAFQSCTGLTGVTIPDSVTTIGGSAFQDCDSLTTITVDTLNSNYSSLNGILFDKAQTLLIQYPGGRAGDYSIPNSVTTIGNGAFKLCVGLTNIIFPDSVTTIGSEAFEYCLGLTSVMIGSGVTTIGHKAFQHSDSLTNIIIPDSVTTIGDYVFYDCTGLTCVTLGNSVTSIGSQAFYYCGELTSLYFKGDAPTLSYSVFYPVDNATAYYIPGTSGWGGTYGGLPTAVWPTSIADVDVNGDVNFADFVSFAAAWGAVDGVDAAYSPLCDINAPAPDSVINEADLAVFANEWLITPCP